MHVLRRTSFLAHRFPRPTLLASSGQRLGKPGEPCPSEMDGDRFRELRCVPRYSFISSDERETWLQPAARQWALSRGSVCDPACRHMEYGTGRPSRLCFEDVLNSPIRPGQLSDFLRCVGTRWNPSLQVRVSLTPSKQSPEIRLSTSQDSRSDLRQEDLG